MATSQHTIGEDRYHGIQRIICISAAIKYYVDTALKKPQKSSIIHDGIDISDGSYIGNIKSKQLLLDELNLSQDVKFVGNISAISVEKVPSPTKSTAN